VLTAPEPVGGHFAADSLRRAIENLVNNAVKYGESGRPVAVAVHQRHDRAVVLVHNHGGAIPADQQESLFRVLQRSTDAEASGKRGWGLGLTQVRGAAEAHGGSVTVNSLPELGTTFTIDIPIDARPFQNRGPAPR
jgi:signal transduction histidine kinase